MKNNDVNPELYEFLKENETGLYAKNKTVFAYVHIYFFNLGDFVKIVGEHHFEEGGIEVQMFNNTTCIDINDIIESHGHYLSSYKNCFDESTWRDYEGRIRAMEDTA